MGKSKVGRPRTLTKRRYQKNQIANVNQWNKKYTRVISVRFNILKDKQVLEHFDKQQNKTEYLRKLILDDISK